MRAGQLLTRAAARAEALTSDLVVAALVLAVLALVNPYSVDVAGSSSHANSASQSGDGQSLGYVEVMRGQSAQSCRVTCEKQGHGCLRMCTRGECGGASADQCNGPATTRDWCLCGVGSWQQGHHYS